MMQAWLRAAVMAAAMAWAGPALAQARLPVCLDPDRPPPARIEVCSALIEATPSPITRSQALLGRARARMEALDAQPGDPPRAAYDPVLADLDASIDLLLSEEALALRALVRFYRGDLAGGLLPLFRGGEWEEAARRLGPVIAAAPRDPDPLLLRAAFRRLTGDQAGAEADRRAARALAIAAR